MITTSIDGEILESALEGYQTVKVTGREALEKDTESYSVGSSDGEILTSTRYPMRKLTVEYIIKEKDITILESKTSILNKLLNVENAEITFSDEPNKFYIGTPVMDEDITDYKGSIYGKFIIKCFTPFAYSMDEKVVTPTVITDPETGDDVLVFRTNNGGTYKSYPVIETQFAGEQDEEGQYDDTGDCSFVSFRNSEDKSLMFGNPNEAETDPDPADPSETLLNRTFDTKTGFTVNSGGRTYAGYYEAKGDVKIDKDMPSSTYKGILPLTYGTGDTCHGPYTCIELPQDSYGHYGAKNFRFSWMQRLCTSYRTGGTELGVFHCLVLDETDGILAGILINKDQYNKSANAYFIVNGRPVKTGVTYDISYYNKYWGVQEGSNHPKWISSINKNGREIAFNIAGYKYTYASDAIENAKAMKIVFYFGKYKDYTPIRYNCVYKATFVKDNAEGEQDVPNQFTSGQFLEVDCKSGEVRLDNQLSPELGDLQNDWENFALKPGLNTIAITYSDWVEEAPTFTMRYREVYL